jgi:penicillin-binding protein 2
VLPSTEWKRKTYKRPEQQRWYAGETISLGIGQGYNNFTMLQLATATATLASGGQRFVPRLVREIEDVVSGQKRQLSAEALPPLALDPAHVQVVTQAMHGVTQEGTSTRIFLGAEYASGGKTGTAQAVGVRQNEKYDKNRIEDYLRDHSLYTAFAPLENPQIAVAIIVENAGFGAAAAAPIVRRVLDYVLTGRYPSTEDIVAVQQGTAAAPIGTPRWVADVPLLPVIPGGVATAAADSATPPAKAASKAADATAVTAPGPAAPGRLAQAPAVEVRP